ncbi:tripartite tricarboxylate transporter permease [Nitratireductor indicus]|uniref:Transmembrane protein n=1 Tax=Nitratireductor indicus C115 TaxID=1231190 RepID=K2PKM1_9HYPH|nr:tripartite tricarboxylate transporter permease [Nitratireductor indicus]EKF41632.1 transmembrane protein [Nitratireductor indicus C115]MDS1136160.1 tripartite tricarboxylate transporter permease [Nitratireductor indicus]SFQ70648.1 TctA family transporter [Nitratireductor indicus]
MNFLSDFQAGLGIALQFDNLLYCFAGVALGTVIGMLPGIGALSTISMLLPLTFYMEPTGAIIMLAGIFYGAQYGGSTASILMNIPGTATNAVTCLDGYPMAKNGRAGVALGMTTIVSFIGGSFSILLLMFLAPLIADVAISFQAPEYFAVILFGLVAASTMASGSVVKGLAMVTVGIVLGLVGLDLNTGVPRFQFGFVEMSDGLSIVALAMGLFGVAEILYNLMNTDGSPFKVQDVTMRSLMPTRQDVKTATAPTIRGMIIGAACGILPGTGATIASFLSYATEKRLSRHPEKFGTGIIEGIAAPEAANNASVQSAFIPTLSLGIPGDAVMAVMLGALMIHGIAPGPALVTQQPELFWGLIMSFWIGNLFLLLLNLPLIGLFVRILKIPYDALYIAMLVFICLGVYSIRNNVFDIFVVVFFGIVGVAMILGRYPAAPLLLGFLLGPMLEENMRRALLVSRGDFSIFVHGPVSATFIVLSVLVLAYGLGRPAMGFLQKMRSRPA